MKHPWVHEFSLGQLGVMLLRINYFSQKKRNTFIPYWEWVLWVKEIGVCEVMLGYFKKFFFFFFWRTCAFSGTFLKYPGFSVSFFLWIHLFIWKVECVWERELQRQIHLSFALQSPLLKGEAEARSQELYPVFPCGRNSCSWALLCFLPGTLAGSWIRSLE